MQRLRRLPLSSVTEYAASWMDQTHRKLASQIAQYVDDGYYLQTYPDVKRAGLDPALHYVKYGWREGRDPSPTFSTDVYLAEHPELLQGDINPLQHFVEDGGAGPVPASAGAAPAQEPSSTAECQLVAPEMDARFYRATYGLAESIDVAAHYCTQGWRLGHDPSPAFSTSYYLTANLDIRESGVNPFWHFLVAGRAEGRSPKHLGGWRYDVLSRLKPLQARKDEWLRREPPPKLLSVQALTARWQTACRAKAVLISIGHDDYRRTPGGVQLCIALEARRAASAKMDYVSLTPWQSLPTFAEEDADPILSVVINAELLGHARMSQLVAAADGLQLRSPRMAIHHLMGHSPEALLEFARKAKLSEAYFWLHDNFSLCPNYALQRNDVLFCNAPDQSSNACAICVYGAERRSHVPRMRRLFAGLDMHVVAPSKGALDFWLARNDLVTASTAVQPHLRLRRRKVARAAAAPGLCRIAFVGYPAPHKGWPVFESLRNTLRFDERYEFWLFSSEDVASDVQRVPVHCTAEAPTAMIEALRAHQIDIVLHWASCRETFSFSTFEALAAGAAVVANAGSGNVAAVVQRQRGGVVLPDQAALMELARADGLLTLADEARTRRAAQVVTVSYSGMTLDRLSDKAVAK
ncbi:MAG: hypothetical protein AAFR73_10695 [Pseudomonadota bacterium]